MEALAIILDRPRSIALRPVMLAEPQSKGVVVRVKHTGISAGTERLLWDGSMPNFPGMGYPLVPGYETVGEVIESDDPRFKPGQCVFVPGARCYKDVRALFGGAASHVIADPDRLHPIDSNAPELTLMALAATAYHAVMLTTPPDLIIGHGVLGQLMARITVAKGFPPPVVHEIKDTRMAGDGYTVIHPDEDQRRDYHTVVDASGTQEVIDLCVNRIAPGGQVVLAGFYGARLSFAFPPAFMRAARIAIAAEWQPGDLEGVRRLLDSGQLSFDGLISHSYPAATADAAYLIAFSDPDCLKMVLNWGGAA